MTAPPEALQFIGSLVAILALAWLARRLGLGPTRTLEDDDAVRRAVAEADCTFAPVRIGRDRGGAGALAMDAEGRIMVLRAHGTHFVARILTPHARAHREGDALVIETAEPRFGHVRLGVDDRRAWETAIAALNRSSDA